MKNFIQVTKRNDNEKIYVNKAYLLGFEDNLLILQYGNDCKELTIEENSEEIISLMYGEGNVKKFICDKIDKFPKIEGIEVRYYCDDLCQRNLIVINKEDERTKEWEGILHKGFVRNFDDKQLWLSSGEGCSTAGLRLMYKRNNEVTMVNQLL